MSEKQALAIRAFTLVLTLLPSGHSWCRAQSAGGFGGYGTTPYNHLFLHSTRV